MGLDRRGVGEKLGEIEGGETVLQLYYMRKKCVLNKRDKRNLCLLWNNANIDGHINMEGENLSDSNPRQRTTGNC